MLRGRLMIDNIKNKMKNKKIPYYQNFSNIQQKKTLREANSVPLT